MAQKKRRTQLVKKRKKKSWFSISAPADFGSRDLGECYLTDKTDLLGRRVRVNMMAVAKTRNPNIRLTFEVTDVKDEKGFTDLIFYNMLPVSIKRMAKKGKTKIGISKTLKSKDGELVIKYIIVTRNKVPSSVSRSINNMSVELIGDEISKKKSSEVFDSVINYSLQKDMKDRLKKIYPVDLFEVRYLKKKEKTQKL
jgi:small subunit ribosomal protein S3Ae